MEWLCDKDRCYRTARLVILSDGRRRPRCAWHTPIIDKVTGLRCMDAEVSDVAKRQEIERREKPGHWMSYEAMVRAWSSRYHLQHNPPACEHCTDGVKPKEIPPAKDGEALYQNTAAGVYGNAGNVRYTFGPGAAVGYVEKWLTNHTSLDRAACECGPCKEMTGRATRTPERRFSQGDYVAGNTPGAVDALKPEPLFVGKEQKCGACLTRLATCIVDVNGSQHAVCGACAEAVKPEPITDKRQNWNMRVRWSADPHIDAIVDPPLRVKPEPRFKAGAWVRHKTTGALFKLAGAHDRFGHYEVEPLPGSPVSYIYAESVEPALPRAGEWWDKRECVDHPSRLTSSGPFEISHGDGSTDCWAKCGCFTPFNFGRGEAK